MTHDEKLLAVITDLRLSFNLLKAMAEKWHKDLGVTASMRAVMEILSDGYEKTVPDMARSRGVSRQHIQTNVNGLVGKGWLKTRPNPQDKRTFLISLSETGHSIFREIKTREAREIARMSVLFSEQEIEDVSSFLGLLNQMLQEPNTAPTALGEEAVCP